MWGGREFWGIPNNFEPDWNYSEEQKKLQTKLIDICRTVIRPNATICDKEYEFPRKSLQALADGGFLGLIVPKELNGQGQNHCALYMVVETIARYGCPCTALVYLMHVGACGALLYRHHDNPVIQDVLRRLDADCLVGTLAYSDPSTGGHFWNTMTSRIQRLADGSQRVIKYGAWCTSAGFADFYVLAAMSPSSEGDSSNYSTLLMFKDEVRSASDEWSSLGMHGNQSGPVTVDCVIPGNRVIGAYGEGDDSAGEIVAPMFLFMMSAAYNGIAMGTLDSARKHVTRKALGDVLLRVCDFPIIQDYFGDTLGKTSCARLMAMELGKRLDDVTGNCDWRPYVDKKHCPRTPVAYWMYMAKDVSTNNANYVTTKMLQACGGTGYKTQLGIERLLRDGFAGCVMAPSSEYIRSCIGRLALMGRDALDYWEAKVNRPVVNKELQKMTVDEKKALIDELQKSVVETEKEREGGNKPTDIDNPFHTRPTAVVDEIILDKVGVSHGPGLNPLTYTALKLRHTKEVADMMVEFRFTLPRGTDYLGTYPGQYVQVRVTSPDGRTHERYFSPVSPPQTAGHVDIVLKFEVQGDVSQFFRALQPGESVEMRGPCGGFEYIPSTLDHVTIISSGGGVTPGVQIIRSVLGNPDDRTTVTLLHYADTPQQILYRGELEGNTDDRLKVALTVGEPDGDWSGEEGSIDTAMIRRHVAPPASNHKIILCGGHTLVLGVLYSLHNLGYPSDAIFVFGQFGDELIYRVYGRNAKLASHRADC